MLQLFRANPGLLVGLVLLGGAALVCGFIALLMKRSGASLRPVVWFGGFFLLIIGPQFVMHLYSAAGSLKREAPRVAALIQLAARDNPAARHDAANLLFGPDIDADLVVDARTLFGDALAKAEAAQFASFASGETVLLARFDGYSDAQKAWSLYLQYTGLNQLGGTGDSDRGYAVTRPVGDRAYVAHLDNMIGVWTGGSDALIRQRITAGGFELPRRAPLAEATSGLPLSAVRNEVNGAEPTASFSSSWKSSRFNVALAAGGLAAYLFVVVLYFFKGAAWAGSSPAQAGIAPLSASELSARLEVISALDVPLRIERGERENEFFATWRYADARWIDLARAHGMRRAFRIRLMLDESERSVRATDYTSSHDWSVGGRDAHIKWNVAIGIVFFHYEHQRVFGLQLDEQGRFKPELSYAYTFNLQELKAPLIEAVTRAGWNWRPVIWQGPRWLRWLTE